jgi:hypothetical protein
MRRVILFLSTIVFLATVSGAPSALACARSIIEPGSDTTDPVHTIKRGTSCSATFNFAQDKINGMRIVAGPRNGVVSIRGNNHYTYRAGSKAGADEFTVEFDTTRYDWYTGNPTWRKTWRVKQPFIVE